MPVTFGQEVPRINTARYAPPDAPIQGGTWGAAMRLENDVLNLVEYISRPQFEPDPEFKPMTRVPTSAFFNNNPYAFAGAQSDAEWDFIETRIAREMKDRVIIESSGVGGIIAAMGAGILSPTILLPAGAAATSARVGTAAGKGAAWTAFGVGLSEGVLHMNQDTRTLGESAFAVGAGAVLGGLLGAGIRYLDPLELDRIGGDMVRSPGGQTISNLVPPPSSGTAQGLSAQAATAEDIAAYRAVADPGGIAESLSTPIAKRLGLQNLTNMSWLGPITRGLASEFSGRRAMTAQFGGAGIHTEASMLGEAVVDGGVLEQVVKQYSARYAQANFKTQELFLEYYKNQGGGRVGAAFNIKSQKEFSQMVGQALFSRIHKTSNQLPSEANRAADVYLNEVFLPVVKEAQHAGLPPFGRLSDDFALDMVTQKVSRMKVGEDYQSVKQIIYENALEQLQQAKLKSEKLASDGELARILESAQFRAKASRADPDARLNLAGFTPEDITDFADLIADELMQKHLSNGLRHGAIDILQQIGEKEAKFVYINPTKRWSNGRTWGEFLEQDVEVLARSFTRSMGPDIELYRRFKVNFRSGEDFDLNQKGIREIPEVKQFMDEVKLAREAASKLEGDARVKRNKEIQAEESAFVRDMNVMVGRLRHTWGQPADPTAVGHRLGKATLQLNTMRLMGSVVLASIPDLARPILKYGFMTTMKQGVLPMLRDFKNFRLMAKEAQYAGEALDVLMHGRTTAMADLFEESDYGGMFLERAMQYGTSRMGIVAAFDYWNTGLKMFSSSIINAELSRAAEAAAKGTIDSKQLRMLGGLQISQADAKAIYRLMENGGGTRTASGALLPNTEDWLKLRPDEIEARARKLDEQHQKGRLPAKKGLKIPVAKGPDDKSFENFLDPARSELLKERQRLLRIYRSAVAQGVADTIITPGLERANWVDASTLGRLIGQFRSFTLSSTFKIALAASQEARAGNMAPIVNGTMFSLALGAFGYYTWAHSVGGETQQRMLNELEDALNGDEKALGRWADEAITRSGLLGVLAEAHKFAERTPGLAPYSTFGQAPTAKSPHLNPATELVGPWLSALDNVGRIIATADDPTSETFRKAKQLMPYQNIFYLRQVFDRMNEMAMDAAGVDYK